MFGCPVLLFATGQGSETEGGVSESLRNIWNGRARGMTVDPRILLAKDLNLLCRLDVGLTQLHEAGLKCPLPLRI